MRAIQQQGVQGLTLGLLDPLQPAARTSARYESIAALGQSAVDPREWTRDRRDESTR